VARLTRTVVNLHEPTIRIPDLTTGVGAQMAAIRDRQDEVRDFFAADCEPGSLTLS
jgi:hypothetical protein